MAALEGRARLDPNRLPRGRSYARSGAVGPLRITPGEVQAPVQGTRAEPYRVRVRVRTFEAAEWDRVLRAIAAQLGHAAALLDGELPPGVAEDVWAVGLDLLPGPGELQPRCSCPDWADPCKHAAAACYLVADVLDSDPFMVFLLRGRGREEVLAGVRAHRAPAAQEGSPSTGAGNDPGVAAREVYAQGERPPLPLPPLPPPRPGRPAPPGADPPPGSGVDPKALAALAADAAARALELALGEGDGGLGFDRDADLARRAAALVGSPGFGELARRAGIGGRELLRRALAWRHGGPPGIEALSHSWQPGAGELDEARAALGPGARAWRNRLTLEGRQLRLGRDGRWYPYRRAGGGWDPAGPPEADPRLAAPR